MRAVIEITSRDEISKAEKNKKMTAAQRETLIEQLTKQMKDAAAVLDFERAAFLRDSIAKLKKGSK